MSLPALQANFIESTTDALIVLEAVRRGILPRVRERLTKHDKNAIKSGQIYCFRVAEAMNRWVDGKRFSPSRKLDNFLLYRELKDDGKDSPRSVIFCAEVKKPGKTQHTEEEVRRRQLIGSLTAENEFKEGGLLKKTIAVGEWHLVAYYTVEDALSGRLRLPTNVSDFNSMRISSQLLQATFRKPIHLEEAIYRYTHAVPLPVTVEHSEMSQLPALPAAPYSNPSDLHCDQSGQSITQSNGGIAGHLIPNQQYYEQLYPIQYACYPPEPLPGTDYTSNYVQLPPTDSYAAQYSAQPFIYTSKYPEQAFLPTDHNGNGAHVAAFDPYTGQMYWYPVATPYIEAPQYFANAGYPNYENGYMVDQNGQM